MTMRALLLKLALFAGFTAASSQAADPLVLLAASKAGRIEAYDAATLYHYGGLGVGREVESVSASPDGRRLYVAQANPKDGESSCCSLFAFDLARREMCPFGSDALFAIPSPDGGLLFTQGSGGLDVFETQHLTRIGRTKVQGAYNLQTSPDLRWLMGITNSPKPSLDIFTAGGGSLVRQIRIPEGPATGTWAGDHYYIFTYGPSGAVLWEARPDDGELHEPRQVRLPSPYNSCNEPVLLMLAGSPDRLFMAEAFGFSIDRRQTCPNAMLGGIYVLEPSGGQVRQIAQSVHVNRMLASDDSRVLYVLESRAQSAKGGDWLVRIDTQSGAILQSASLTPGHWNMTLARIPAGLIPQGKERPVTYCMR